MHGKKIFLLIILLVIAIFTYKFSGYSSKKEISKDLIINEAEEEPNFNSNIILDVNYSAFDSKGNQYLINAKKGEIDLSDTNIIFLTNVTAIINLNHSNIIKIKSDYGKYNINNYDSIFSKNVLVEYIDNTISSEYLDFSINRNTMIISKNIIYNNKENILKADTIEVDIKTKDTKIYMYENKKRVNLKNKLN